MRAVRHALAGAVIAAATIAGVHAPAGAVTPPTVQIVTPVIGSVLRGASQQLEFQVAQDPSSTVAWFRAAIGATKLALTPVSVCGAVSACDDQFTFSSIGAPNGAQTLQVTVGTSTGQIAFASVPVTVDNPVPVAGNLRLTTPVRGGTVYGTVGLQADAAEDANPLGATIKGVRFYRDGALISEDDQAPYAASVTSTPPHPAQLVYAAAAVDTAGDLGPQVHLQTLAEIPPTIDSIQFAPDAVGSAWGIDPNSFVNFHAASMSSGNPNALNYLASERLLIDGVVRDTATPGTVGGPTGGNCQLGCLKAAENVSGYNKVSLTPRDAGWHTITVHVVDRNGGFTDLRRRIYIDPGPALAVVNGHHRMTVASGSTLHLAAAAVAGGPTLLGQTSAILDGRTSIADMLCNEKCGRATTIQAHWQVPALATGTHTITFWATSSARYTPVTLTLHVVVLPSTLSTLTASTRVLHRASMVTFTGALRRLGGTGLPDHTVYLQRRVDSAHPWTTVRSAHTDHNGQATFRVYVARSTHWRLRFLGSAPYLASNSATTRIARA